MKTQTKTNDQKISDGFRKNNDVHEADTSVTGDYTTGLLGGMGFGSYEHKNQAKKPVKDAPKKDNPEHH